MWERGCLPAMILEQSRRPRHLCRVSKLLSTSASDGRFSSPNNTRSRTARHDRHSTYVRSDHESAMELSRGGPHVGSSRSERPDQLANFRRCRCSSPAGDCRACMGEYYARPQQSRTKRNTGIHCARSDPTASRSQHRNGALSASYRLPGQRYRSLSRMSVSGSFADLAISVRHVRSNHESKHQAAVEAGNQLRSSGFRAYKPAVYFPWTCRNIQ